MDEHRKAEYEKPLSASVPLALGMFAGMGGGLDNLLPKIKKRKVKKCLVCDIKHTHNNAFCSAECCKNYNPTNKGEGR